MFAPTPVSGNQCIVFELLNADGSTPLLTDVTFFGPPDALVPTCNNRHLRIQHSLLTPGASAIKPAFCKCVLAKYGTNAVREVRVIAVKQSAPALGGAPGDPVRRVEYRYRVPVCATEPARQLTLAR